MLRFFKVLLLVSMVTLASADNPLISNDLQATMYLANFGYLHPALKNISSNALFHVSKEAYRHGIAEFQSFAGLEPTGVLDEKTLEVMNKPRCGVPDREYHTPSATTPPTRRKRFSVEDGNRWTNKHPTYDIKDYTSKLSRNEVDREIARAFKFWENVTPLAFEQVTKGEVDIVIRFVQKEHGCSYVDNNDPGIHALAHAFPPGGMNSTKGENSILGDIHFHESVMWTVDSHRGTNLLYLAVLEIGHSLGLFHSTVHSSVMLPIYKGYNPDLKLSDDDIAGIQHLYGKNEHYDGGKSENSDDHFDKEFKETKKQLAETRSIVEDLKTKLNEVTRKPVDIGRIPTSCEDLQRMGNTLNGVFLVKRSKKMETVYCDFSPLNGKKLETWIGTADVKSAPTYFYVTRNYSLSSDVGPIPFHLALVNAGNAMDLKTGTFTAPKSGTYFFSFTGMANFPQSSSLLRLGVGFFLNGRQVSRSFVDEANSVNFQKSQLTFQSTFLLNEGDRIWLQIIIMGSGVSLYDNEWHYTHFTGFILDEDLSL